ncbi:MAG: hypothetical protein ACI9J3_001171 [Parvicellaceae bacterium]|jgi:hypothetical protein
MKNIFIVLLVLLLIGENVFIYLKPEVVSDLVKEKGDSLKGMVFSNDMVQEEFEEIKGQVKIELKDEMKKEMEAKIDSMFAEN